MDVFRLDAATYLPDSLIEGYNTMIWTERYLPNGEFEMKTAKVEETRVLIPEGRCIGLLDSPEVMIVENHSIGVDDQGVKELTITGRTFETVAEQRVARIAVYSESMKMTQLYKTSDMAAFLLWNHLVNTSTEDPTGAAWVKSDSLSAITNLVITDSTNFSDIAKSWYLDKGVIYPQVLDFLSLMGIGIRNIRPSNTTANIMSFDITRTGTRGAVSEISTPNISQLRIDLYNGIDRTRQNNTNPVIFHYNSGHIDSPKYLFSIKDYKNVATITSSTGNLDIWPDTGLTPSIPNPSGFNRRVLYIDGGDLGTQIAGDFQASNVQKGLIELSKHNLAKLFDGAISAISPYKYGKDYFLGDFVTLMAEYGFESPMMVSEYVRTEDQDGDRGYPTLILAS